MNCFSVHACELCMCRSYTYHVDVIHETIHVIKCEFQTLTSESAFIPSTGFG